MDNSLIKALQIILISLGLALLFNILFFDKQPGISVFIFTVVLLGSVYYFGKLQQLRFGKSWWLMVLIAFFSLMPGIRDNPFLNFLNVCAALSLLMLLAYELIGTPAWLMRLRDYVVLMVFGPFRMLRTAFTAVSLVGQIHSNVRHRDVWIRIIKGIVMAVPVLIIFGVLFSQADLVFSQFVKSFIHISLSPRSVQYLVLLCIAFVSALGFLSYIFFPKFIPSVSSTEQSYKIVPGKEIEVLVFLSLIATLFLVFIGFQITYLFGGESNILNAGFSYAEYARRGFWELLAVAIISLAILLASEWYAGVESKKEKKFLIPALILIAEVIVVIISAFKRLSLYIDVYGMTMLRFYVAGFIILLLGLFILLAVKFILSKPEQFFAFNMVLLFAAFLIIINFINPDGFIIQSNIRQYVRTGKVDSLYARELSADAVPGEIELYGMLQGVDKEGLKNLLLFEKGDLQERKADWQSINYSRAQALKLLEGLSN